MSAIIDLPESDVFKLQEKMNLKNRPVKINSNNKKDREIIRLLNWDHNPHIYKLDFGNTAYRLYFGLDIAQRRCYILALDTDHDIGR